MSAHREENVDSDVNFLKLIKSLNLIAENYKMPIIVSTHPRTQKRIDALDTKLHSLIQLLKPLGFKDYNKLQISAKGPGDFVTNADKRSEKIIIEELSLFSISTTS